MLHDFIASVDAEDAKLLFCFRYLKFKCDRKNYVYTYIHVTIKEIKERTNFFFLLNVNKL